MILCLNNFHICSSCFDCCLLDSYNDFHQHLKNPKVTDNIRSLLKRLSDVSRSALLGSGSSLGFLFTKEINVRFFAAALFIHYWPERNIEHTRDLAMVANVKRVAATLLGAVHRLVAQLSGPNGWSGVSRDEIIGFNGVLDEYYTVFNTFKRADEPLLKERLEHGMNFLIRNIVQFNEMVDRGEPFEVQVNKCMDALQEIQNKYVQVFGEEEFGEFTRRRVQYV